MGVVLPEGFDTSRLDAAERRVVRSFVDGLSDGWLVVPDVCIRDDTRDHQLDVVLVHREFGIADIEVKSHKPNIRDGTWFSGNKPMGTQPLDQARDNSYALRKLLRKAHPLLERVEVEYAVALPNTRAVKGAMPPGLDPSQLMTAPSLDAATDAVESLMCSRTRNQPLTDDQVEAVVAALLPDVAFEWDPAARNRRTRERLDDLCADQTRALERLDANRRVVAVGAVGTGKTCLAMAWARRALVRDERVLLTCYNEPLADVVRERMVGDESLVVGPFLRLALGLAGMPPLDVPADADHQWWTVTAVAHLLANWHLVTERFDTIVVDEAQDFSPAWLALIEALLDPDGPRRTLLLADPRQELYTRGFDVPSADDGWVRCELVNNCRNAHEIASILRRSLGGAPSPVAGPEAVGLRWVPARDLASATDAARGALARLAADPHHDPARTAVLTVTSRVRDHLVAMLGLVRWEHRGDGILCENVHRVKGLEFDSVVLVLDDAQATDDLLAGGISRAVSELVLVAPELLATRLHLTTR